MMRKGSVKIKTSVMILRAEKVIHRLSKSIQLPGMVRIQNLEIGVHMRVVAKMKVAVRDETKVMRTTQTFWVVRAALPMRR